MPDAAAQMTKRPQPGFVFLRPEQRVAAAFRALQAVMREYIEPDSEMTTAEFADRALSIIDNTDTNAALDEIEK